MGLFTPKSAWGAQMSNAKGTKSAKEARAEAHKKNNPSTFKQRKDAAKSNGRKK